MDTSEEHVVWDLSDLYEGFEDPRIMADKRCCMEEADRFARTYSGRVALLSPEELHAGLASLETLEEKCERIASFAYLSFVTQTQDPAVGSLWQSAQEFESLIRCKTLFFELEWSQAPEGPTLSAHRALARYRHHLEKMRALAPHRLSEPEEKIMENLSLSGQKAWVNLFDKLMGQMRLGRDRRPMAAALAKLYQPDRKIRRSAALEVTAGLKRILPLTTHIHNALGLDKALRDGMRSLPHWLRNMNLRNELTDEQVSLLVRSVTARYDIVQDYYLLKREILGLRRLYDYDRYAPLPGLPTKRFTWEEAREKVMTAYESFSPEAAGGASLFFDRKWIHAASLQGKPSGAFSHPTVPACHPFISLHFTGTHRDVMTLAHELGHGIHQFLSREQGLYNTRVPLIMAETASVFSEMLVFEKLLGEADTPDMAQSMLCGKLEDLFSTTFRQISMNRFEDAIHRERREGGELSSDRLSSLWMSTQQEMFGRSVVLGNHYRIWWSYIPHFVHTPGYVYAYTFAELTALSLLQEYRLRGPEFVPGYMDLLRSGSHASPQELLKPLGLDISKPSFYEKGLNIIEEMLKETFTRLPTRH
jgi:oligoendopeptidase F